MSAPKPFNMQQLEGDCSLSQFQVPQDIEKTVHESELSARATGGFGPTLGPQSIFESSSSHTGSGKATTGGRKVKPALKAQRPHAS